METPLSMKRITRSQTKAAAASMNSVPMSRKNEEVPESKQRNGGKSDRSALIDITNDSPIVGLAMGGSLMKTPSSFSKKKDLPKMRMIMTTPGSGEALLRREVKTLLQKVEEEAAEGSKLSFEHHHHHHRLFLHFEEDHVVDPSSSAGFGVLRPQAMMNNNNNSTPHVFFNLPSKSNGSGDHHNKGNSLIPSQEVEAEFRIPQVVEGIDDGLMMMKQESIESEKSLITRSLLFDFSEKSSSSVEASSESSSICSSVGSVGQVLLQSNEEEDDGVWSIRVNNKSSTSSIQSNEEEEEEEEYYEEDEYYYEEESEGGGLMIDELCEGVMKISVNEKMMGWRIGSEFEGKHTRFVYNSEDEIEGEEEDVVVMMGGMRRKSPLQHLKGLPIPAGKHLRFSSSNEDAEEQDY